MRKIKIYLTIISVLTISFLGLYFYQIQELVRGSYLLSNTQKDFLKIETENLSFSQQNVENSSLAKIEEEVLALNFIKNDRIKYIPLSNDYLVRK